MLSLTAVLPVQDSLLNYKVLIISAVMEKALRFLEALDHCVACHSVSVFLTKSSGLHVSVCVLICMHLSLIQTSSLLLCREKIKPRKFQLAGFVIEAYACQLHVGPVTNHVTAVNSHMNPDSAPKQSPEASPDSGPSSGATHSVEGDGNSADARMPKSKHENMPGSSHSGMPGRNQSGTPGGSQSGMPGGSHNDGRSQSATGGLLDKTDITAVGQDQSQQHTVPRPETLDKSQGALPRLTSGQHPLAVVKIEAVGDAQHAQPAAVKQEPADCVPHQTEPWQRFQQQAQHAGSSDLHRRGVSR